MARHALPIVIAFAPLLPSTAFARPFAQPPEESTGGSLTAGQEPTYASRYREDSRDDLDDSVWMSQRSSPVRLHMGGAARTDARGLTPGLVAAADIGRGPAGFRATGLWLRVGSDDGLAQYTGELTLDVGGRSAWRPVLGAGAGLARTHRVDSAGRRTSGGASVGVGLLRLALEFRLPVSQTDARAGLSAIGTLPAIRGSSSPDLGPWLVIGLTLGVGL